MRSPKALLLASTIAATCAIPGARAQVTPQDTAAAELDTGVLQEIIVTAQRRAENIQDVPISVSAYSGEQLEKSGVTGVGDLQFLAPSVSFTNTISSSGEGVIIRGVGTPILNDGFEPSVSIVIDGVVVGRSGAGLNDLVDIERVEVLRGPQGTLFGKNASAGAISVTTKGPTATPEVEGKVSYDFEYDEIRTFAAASGPVSDKVGYRVSAFYNERGPTVRNITPGGGENDQKNHGARAKLRFDPSDALTATLSAEYYRENQDCCMWSIAALPTPLPASNPLSGFYGPTDPFFAFNAGLTQVPPQIFQALGLSFIPPLTQLAYLPNIQGIQPGPKNRTIAGQGAHQDSTTKAFSLNADYDLGGVTLRSITGYRHWDNDENWDTDSIGLDLIERTGNSSNLKTFSQEFQIISAPSDTLEYVAGLYYFDQTLDSGSRYEGSFQGVPQSVIDRIVFISNNLFNLPLAPWRSGEKNVMTNDRSTDTLNYAAFGQATWKFTPQFHGIVGARVLREEIDVETTRTGRVPLYVDGTLDASAKLKDTAWVGKVGAQFYPTEDVMTFATVSRGYKGRAVDNDPNTQLTQATFASEAVLKPEIPTSYEAGVKSTLLGSRLILNATAFLTDFKDFQSSSFDGQTGTYILSNAGKLRTKGVEVDFQARPVPQLTLGGGGAYNKATYRDYRNAECSQTQVVTFTCPNPNPTFTGGTQDVSGGDLPNAPRWTYNLYGQYDHDFGAVGAYVRAEIFWRDDTLMGSDQDPRAVVPDYEVVNARIGITAPDGQWELALWAKNLFDKDYAVTYFDMPIWGGYAQFLGLERQFGLEARFRF